MTELRPITLKHKLCDAAMIRRAVARFRKRKQDVDSLYVLLYLEQLSRHIEDAFAKPSNVVQFPRGDGPERAA